VHRSVHLENHSTRNLKGGLLSSFREQMRGFHYFLKQKPSLFMFRWSSVCHFPDDTIHVPGFGEQVIDDLELNCSIPN
jgi:hypothetical protein